jgi:hypothetical protein
MPAPFARTAVLAGCVFLASAIAYAQVPASPSPTPGPAGHWEGAIDVNGTPLAIEIDITKDAAGALAATFGQPAQGVRGLPLGDLKADGRTLTFALKAGPATSSFKATVSDDGKTMTGTVEQGGRTMPFTATRNGDARVMAAPKNAAVTKDLEGTWNGLLEVGGRQMRLVLKIANQADGTSTGSIQNQDIAGPELAVGLTQKDKTLAVDVPAISGSFNGTLNADGTELSGTWTQAGGSLPLVFKKGAK